MNRDSLSTIKQMSLREQEQWFLEVVQANPVIKVILDRSQELQLDDWYLTAGGVFQTIWNHIDGRDPQQGIKDYDVFFFNDEDLSYESEDKVIQLAAGLYADVDAEVEVRNEARVHLWYEDHFGVPAKPFISCADAIDHFASTTCCYGVTKNNLGELQVYAPHGFDDLIDMVIRPNPRLAPRDVYETKAARWCGEWPSLQVLPWPEE